MLLSQLQHMSGVEKYWYGISYMWYGVVAILIAIIVSFVVSFITGAPITGTVYKHINL